MPAFSITMLVKMMKCWYFQHECWKNDEMLAFDQNAGENNEMLVFHHFDQHFDEAKMMVKCW